MMALKCDLVTLRLLAVRPYLVPLLAVSLVLANSAWPSAASRDTDSMTTPAFLHERPGSDAEDG